MSKILTVDDLLLKVEKMRNERYEELRMWVKSIKKSSDLQYIQDATIQLEKALLQCETLDDLLHDLYVGLEQTEK